MSATKGDSRLNPPTSAGVPTRSSQRSSALYYLWRNSIFYPEIQQRVPGIYWVSVVVLLIVALLRTLFLSLLLGPLLLSLTLRDSVCLVLLED